ncbi:phytanoyl-CoA dioxygenase family protein [Nannocystis pusilla]|uniref:Phytanoyl-CoA dioxygenase family protein n=1 Tax=Nannocystis pusilla TaxID=889268 RepID=A0ABS7TLX5_9BACT|nr:phytanoyl-CoA dioxygenase family protein [Nannocystis pusilla]MBZ5709228.1 phytanoyl-CoA dioxygenase family protein [Nannocystis pusilla]
MEAAQFDIFREQGCLRLDGFHPRKRMAPIKQRVLDELKRLKVWGAGKSLSNRLQGLPAFQQIGKLSSLVTVPGLQDALMTRELLAVMIELAGRAPSPGQGIQLLLSPPQQGDWTLHGLNWHVDMAAAPGERAHGIQAFVLIDDVAPRGGATLALAGSHRAPGPELREVLRTSTDLAASLRAMGLGIVEMSGRAGDVFLMDMRVLHTPSINSTKNMRMMATSRYSFDQSVASRGR